MSGINGDAMFVGLCGVSGQPAQFGQDVAAAVCEHAPVIPQDNLRCRLAYVRSRARARARHLFEGLRAIIVAVLGVLGVISMFGTWVEKAILRALDAFEVLVTLALSMLGALGMVGLLIWFVQTTPVIGCALLLGLVRCFRSMDLQAEIADADTLVDSLPKVSRGLLGSAVCPICLDDFDDTRQISRTTCGDLGGVQDPHAFHTDCLRVWLFMRQTCPLCRQDVAPGGPPEAPPLDILTTASL